MSKKEIIYVDLWASDSTSVKHSKSTKAKKSSKGTRKKGTVSRPPSRPGGGKGNA